VVVRLGLSLLNLKVLAVGVLCQLECQGLVLAVDVEFVLGHDIIVVLDDDVAHIFALDCFLDKLVVLCLFFLVLHNCLEVLVEVWELIKNLLECGCLVLKSADVGFSDVVLADWLLEK
jgi:hypothetical protein